MSTKTKNKLVKCVSYSLLCGLICHGYCFFNKFLFHDEANSFNNVGSTFKSGRWMLGLLGNAIKYFFGTNHYSMPLFNGILTLLFIAAISFLIADKINISSNKVLFLLCGVMVSFPTVTSTFGYIFCAPYYFFGTLLSVLGAFYFYNHKSVFSLIVCSILMAASAGIYQSNITVSISILLLFMIDEITKIDYLLKDYLLLAIKNVVICLMFITIYFIANSFFINFYDVELVSYQGINNFGFTSISEYVVRIIDSYIAYINPDSFSEYTNMFPNTTIFIYKSLLILEFIAVVLYLFRIWKTNKIKFFELSSLFALIPIATRFIFVMVDNSIIHSLMTYGYVFGIVFIMLIYELLDNEHYLIIKNTTYFLLLTLVISYARLSNICYLKYDVLQTNAVNYYNRLIERIESTEGYSVDMPIVYINEANKNVDSFNNNFSFEESNLVPYCYLDNNNMVNNYTWKKTMAFWCGFNPNVISSDKIINEKEVTDMPAYPSDGSIKIIDGMIVVKFANN